MVAVLAGCGRIAFDPRADASSDGSALDDSSDAPLRTTCDWTNGPQFRTAPVLHMELSSTVSDLDPYLVAGDPTTIFLSSDRSGSYDTFRAQRPSVGAPFSMPAPVAGFATTAVSEAAFNVERGGLTGHVVRDQAPYEVTFSAGSYQLGRRLTELETRPVTTDPFAIDDGRLLAFSSGTASTATLIYFASRADRTQPWSNVRPFELSTGVLEGGATMTADGLVIVWARQDPQAQVDIFYSVRTSTAVPFTDTRDLIRTPALENEPFIRDDGCELFFSQQAAGLQDIYSVEILP